MDYSRCSIVKAGALLAFPRPSDAVHKDSNTHDTKKIKANHAVNFFKTSAVDVPKRESDASPPKEAPSPVLLLSWMRMMKHSKAQSIKNSVIAVKYKNVIIEKFLLLIF